MKHCEVIIPHLHMIAGCALAAEVYEVRLVSTVHAVGTRDRQLEEALHRLRENHGLCHSQRKLQVTCCYAHLLCVQ